MHFELEFSPAASPEKIQLEWLLHERYLVSCDNTSHDEGGGVGVGGVLAACSLEIKFAAGRVKTDCPCCRCFRRSVCLSANLIVRIVAGFYKHKHNH